MKEKIKVAFQGEKGAYSHLASLEVFPNSLIKACPTFEEVFQLAKTDPEYRIVIPIENSIKISKVNSAQLTIDRGRPEIDQMIQLSSFLANGIGARGTPAFFINEEFIGGFISKQQIISLLK